MITLYYGSSSRISRQASAWFKYRNIVVKRVRIEFITKKDLIRILSLSEKGFEDILKREQSYNKRMQGVQNHIESLQFQEAIEYILENTHVLRVPIALDVNKLFIGYNSDELRTFISRVRSKPQNL